MTQPCVAECIAFGAFSCTAVGEAATAALTEEELSNDDEEAADEEQKGMTALVGVRAHLNIFLETSYSLMVALGLKDICHGSTAHSPAAKQFTPLGQPRSNCLCI